MGQAGEQIALDACRFASVSGEGDLLLYKNNTDNKGASYGAHENYLVRRSTPFGDIVRHLTPFFVSRQWSAVPAGSGSGRTATATVSRSASALTTSRWRSVSRRR